MLKLIPSNVLSLQFGLLKTKSMALAARSLWLSPDENVCIPPIGFRLSINRRSQRKSGRYVEEMQSSMTLLRRSQLMRFRDRSCISINNSSSLPTWRKAKNNFPMRRMSSGIRKVIPASNLVWISYLHHPAAILYSFHLLNVKVLALVREVPNVLKEWSQSHIIKLAALVACSFLIIPSADAVDALKTCACLLKECRYCNLFPFDPIVSP